MVGGTTSYRNLRVLDISILKGPHKEVSIQFNIWKILYLCYFGPESPTLNLHIFASGFLQPINGLGFGIGMWLGWVWSG